MVVPVLQVMKLGGWRDAPCPAHMVLAGRLQHLTPGPSEVSGEWSVAVIMVEDGEMDGWGRTHRVYGIWGVYRWGPLGDRWSGSGQRPGLKWGLGSC